MLYETYRAIASASPKRGVCPFRPLILSRAKHDPEAFHVCCCSKHSPFASLGMDLTRILSRPEFNFCRTVSNRFVISNRNTRMDRSRSHPRVSRSHSFSPNMAPPQVCQSCIFEARSERTFQTRSVGDDGASPVSIGVGYHKGPGRNMKFQFHTWLSLNFLQPPPRVKPNAGKRIFLRSSPRCSTSPAAR